MKPKPIGIVGGAGPLAGSLLLERVLTLSGTLYGCRKDADYPKVTLLSYPFSEMLTTTTNIPRLRSELRECLNQLRGGGASVLAIACNTLHAFLDESDLVGLVHLPRETAAEIPSSDVPLVLCTTTSALFSVHKEFFPCMYPDVNTQEQVDAVIEMILCGSDRQKAVQHLSTIIRRQANCTIVLGCTELSLYKKYLPACGKNIIDPLEAAAKRILQESFNKQSPIKK